MAAAAIILADVTERLLEGFEVLHACAGGLRIAAKLREACLEVVHVLPDFRTGGVRIIRRRLVDRMLLEIKQAPSPRYPQKSQKSF